MTHALIKNDKNTMKFVYKSFANSQYISQKIQELKAVYRLDFSHSRALH